MTTINRTQAVYDRIAEKFAAVNAAMPPELAADARCFIDMVGAGAHVLDMGCGAGRDMTWLKSLGATVVGCDLSAGMLAQARRQAGSRLIQADMRRLALRSGCFRGVWCCAALLHLPKADAPRALAEVRRVLVSGGALLLTVQEGTGEGWEHTMRYGQDVERFFARYSAEEMATLLTDSGFTLQTHAVSLAETRRWLRYFAMAQG